MIFYTVAIFIGSFFVGAFCQDPNAAPPQFNPCPSQFNYSQELDQCFLVVNVSAGADDADKFCKDQGAELFVIRNFGDKQLCVNKNPDPNGLLWVGDAEKFGRMTFQNEWCPSYPVKSFTRTCFLFTGNCLVNVRCENRFPFICRAPKLSAPPVFDSVISGGGFRGFGGMFGGRR